MPEYKLPDPGEGLTEAEIVAWKVKVGDVVKINDVVVEIETAKSLVELPSPYAGEVTAILVQEGETVEVGTPIIAIGEAAKAAEPAETKPEAAAEAEEAPMKTLVGYGPRTVEAKRRPRKGGATPATEAGAATQMQVQGSFAPGGAQSQAVVEADEPAVPARAARTSAPAESNVQVLAKPPVRKLAKDLGIDLRSVTPTGPNGTITRADVEGFSGDAAAASEPAAFAPAVRSGERETREPIKGVRKMMGQAMVQSAFTAPHVTEWITVDVTKTMKYVEKLQEPTATSAT